MFICEPRQNWNQHFQRVSWLSWALCYWLLYFLYWLLPFSSSEISSSTFAAGWPHLAAALWVNADWSTLHSPVPLRKLLAKAWTSSLVANKSPSVPLKISWEEARWGGGFRNAVDCDYRHSLGIHGLRAGGTGAAGEIQVIFAWGDKCFWSVVLANRYKPDSEGPADSGERKKTMWGLSLPKDQGFCFGGVFYI